MPERKGWTEEQDRVLKFLKEERMERKWANIARLMSQEFGLEGRSGKQCRQRYHNHLNSTIIVSEWTPEEESLLFHWHSQVGNKWSIISHKIPGRSDNCVKNHFYSKLRKAMRRLNKFILQQNRMDFSQIKASLIYKIIQTTQSKFKLNSKVDQEVADFCIGTFIKNEDIKNRLFQYQYTNVQKNQSEQQYDYAVKLIEDIMLFERDVKKGFKYLKRDKEGIREGHFLKPPRGHMKIKKANSENSQVSSQNSSSSFISSSSIASSCSDLSDSINSANFQQKKGSKTTGPRSIGNSSGNYSDIVKQKEEKEEREEKVGKLEKNQNEAKLQIIQCESIDSTKKDPRQIYYTKAQKQQNFGMEPENFQAQYEGLIQIQMSNSQKNQENQGFHYKDIFYDDTPLMARILAPNPIKMDEENEDRLFMECQDYCMEQGPY